ncbi:MAG: peptidoglycan DD-metalloendopeptidase family protein, partial [Succinivibrio sp.]|nr:peptidoglycan DD-metalloendopeptidase family protein [Succinivibrio sp.]
YAHNDMLLVKEGQNVKRGQVIAKMGSTDASRVMLHFEIRYKGNSVNPRNYLPK